MGHWRRAPSHPFQSTFLWGSVVHLQGKLKLQMFWLCTFSHPILNAGIKLFLVWWIFKNRGTSWVGAASGACTADLYQQSSSRKSLWRPSPTHLLGQQRQQEVCFLHKAPMLPSGYFIHIKHHHECCGQLLMPPWAEQCLGTLSRCPTLGHARLPARGIAVGLGLYQLCVTIATLHLTSLH